VPTAEAKGVKLSASMDKAAIGFTGHKTKLQRLLGNLIDNAIKFTPSGGSVAVTAFQSLDGIELSVSDTGTGIDPASHEKIFERGFRTKDAIGQPGFGLGLALAKSIVAFYHGSIGCKSELGKGTTFTVHLPT
jgi:signal transduction histidine kinase